MKQKIPHLISLKLGQSQKSFIKNERVLFAKDQFAVLMKKNLRIPVSIFHL